MLIIIDHKMSLEAKKKLSAFGNLMELKTEDITYPAISGHPDIFFCQAPGHLIVAPNLPEKYFDQLRLYEMDFITGELPVGPEYPSSARYNAVATDRYLIHNFRHTDFLITRTLDDLQPVHTDQGYTRCNLLPLKEGHFITSDPGIYKVLTGCHLPGIFPISTPEHQQNKAFETSSPGCHLKILFISPAGILLESFPHGFFGGCCGILEDKVFINGSLDHFPEGEKVRQYLENLDYRIIQLSRGQLEDVGSILFV